LGVNKDLDVFERMHFSDSVGGWWEGKDRAEVSGCMEGREFIDYKTSMITDYDPLRGLLFY